MDRPCVVGKITPVIPEDAELHDEHRYDHPYVKGFILIHLNGSINLAIDQL